MISKLSTGILLYSSTLSPFHKNLVLINSIFSIAYFISFVTPSNLKLFTFLKTIIVTWPQYQTQGMLCLVKKHCNCHSINLHVQCLLHSILSYVSLPFYIIALHITEMNLICSGSKTLIFIVWANLQIPSYRYLSLQNFRQYLGHFN